MRHDDAAGQESIFTDGNREAKRLVWTFAIIYERKRDQFRWVMLRDVKSSSADSARLSEFAHDMVAEACWYTRDLDAHETSPEFRCVIDSEALYLLN